MVERKERGALCAERVGEHFGVLLPPLARIIETIAIGPSPDEDFINRVLANIHEHLEDEDYDRDALAADIGASPSTLYNKIRSITGMSVSVFIRDVRLKEAKRLAIENPSIRVSDLAYSVGFRDPRYFSTCFKKHYGVQPKEFIESLYVPYKYPKKETALKK